MAFDVHIMKDFIEEHQSQYIGKYRFHSGYRVSDTSFKNHYYMLDENFRQIDIYVDIQFKDEITYHFSEDLHEQEKIYIVKDALAKIIEKMKHKSSLHYSLYESYIKTFSNEHLFLEPIDYYDLLNYMKYHNGINQKTMDDYYHMFIPCLEMLVNKGNYKKFIESIQYLLNMILYEYEWNGVNSKYLDTEYQYHLYYIREIIRLVYKHLDKFYLHVKDELFEVIELLCSKERFCFAIMTDFGSMILAHHDVTRALIDVLKKKVVLSDKDENRENVNIVFSYIYYIFENDYEQYYAVVLKVLRNVVKNMLTFANHDLDLALGNSLIKTEGYEIILDLFHEDYNTFIFSCFPIDSFPKELRTRIRDELITAVQFFAARMENDKYRHSSFEQVTNINRLLMYNFKEWNK